MLFKNLDNPTTINFLTSFVDRRGSFIKIIDIVSKIKKVICKYTTHIHKVCPLTIIIQLQL